MSKASIVKQFNQFFNTAILLSLVSLMTLSVCFPSRVMAIYNENNPLTLQTRSSSPLVSEAPINNDGPKLLNGMAPVSADPGTSDSDGDNTGEDEDPSDPGSSDDDTGKKKHKNSKEIKELRTANSRTYLNSNGSKTLEYSAIPVNYKDADGNWQEITTRLSPDPTYNLRTNHGFSSIVTKYKTKTKSFADRFSRSDFFRSTNMANPFATRAFRLSTADITAYMKPFAEGIEVIYEGQKFNIEPVGANNVVPVVKTIDGNRVVIYKNAWKGVDVEYASVGGNLKESIILKKPGTQHDFQFKFSGGELIDHPTTEGALAIDGVDDEKFFISPLVIYEYGVGAVSEDISSQTTDGQNIFVSLDSEWLKAQTKDKYPIIIDPTFHRQNEIQYQMFKSDGYKCTGAVCYANTGSLYDRGWKTWRTYIYFPYSELNDKHILSAKIHGYFKSGLGGSTANYSMDMGHANCINFNCLGTLVGSDSTVSTDFDINFKDGLQAAINNDDFGAWWSISGVEGTLHSYKPYWDMSVDVTYNSAPPMTNKTSAKPIDKSVITSTRPVLKVSPVTDADGDKVKYYFRLATNPNAETGTVVNSGWITSTQWTVPDDILQDGRTYYWHVHTYDGIDVKAPTWVNSFKVDLRRGKSSTQAYQEVGPVGIELATGNTTTSTGSHSISALGGDIGISLTYNSPVMSSPGLLGQYWNGDISGSPVMTRIDSSASFNWGSDSPAASVNADNFSGRWTGYIVVPETGDYILGCYADDECSLYIDNNLVASRTTVGAAYANPIHFTAGVPVAYKIESHENAGNAKIYSWMKDADGNPSHIDASWFVTEPTNVSKQYGLTGRYYSDDGSHAIPSDPNDKERLLMVRNDEKIYFDWRTGSPAPGMATDNFLIRWNGYLTVPESGSYILGGYGDDGIVIKLDANNNGNFDSDETVLNSWTYKTGNRWGTAKNLTAGVRVPIQVDFREATGAAKFRLLIDPFNGGGQEMPVSWLTYDANILPKGWNMAVGNGSARFEKMYVGSNNVTLTDSTGQTYEYKWNNGAYVPPKGEQANVLRNTDGSFTITDTDGSVYVFDNDGKLSSFVSPVDDKKPAALRYEYSGNPARLTKIIDGIDPSRYGTLHYSGDSECIKGDDFYATPNGMLCAFTTTDGNRTVFQYDQYGNLSRVIAPGGAQEDYSYDSLRRMMGYRGVLANDTIQHYVRDDNDSTTTEIDYDIIGRASAITAPSAEENGYRVKDTFEYIPSTSSQLGSTIMHVVGASEPKGYSKVVKYDDKLRSTEVTNLVGLTSKMQWDADKDMVLSSTDATGLKTTYIYNDQDILTDTYGPAPSAWFDSNTRLPLSQYVDQTPHVKTNYDEGLVGFDTSWYNLKSDNMTIFGAPIYNHLGYSSPANSNPANTRFNWRNYTLPATPDTSISGVDGYAVRARGKITFPSSGTYTFKAYADDSIRLIIDNQQKISNWGTKTEGATQNNYTATFSATAGKTYDIYVEYGHTGTTGAFDVWLSGPGIADQSGSGLGTRDWSNYLKPGYNLSTSTISYDSVLGDTKTKTEYSNPAYGLISKTIVDPDGLALENQATYEDPGTGYLRQTDRTTAGGSVFTYEYYGATEKVDNPCTPEVDPVSQAGRAKGKTEPDPDGSGPQTGRKTEAVYNSRGVAVATRYNNDSWTCYTYDNRGRLTTNTTPARGSYPNRISVNDYLVDNNPLVNSSADQLGKITTTFDLLGNISIYTDANLNTTYYAYDNYGKLLSKTSAVGFESYTYDDYDRLEVYKLNNISFASIYYDQFSRLDHVQYQNGMTLDSSMRDSLNRISKITYEINGTEISDEISRSVSGPILSDNENGTIKNYSYDDAGRLTKAIIGDNYLEYIYEKNDNTCDSQNINSLSYKNSNRTKMIFNNDTTTYCYDYTDRLISSSDPLYDKVVYDDHGNTISLGHSSLKTIFGYDNSDRNISITEVSDGTTTSIEYARDSKNRIIKRISHKDDKVINHELYGFSGFSAAPDFIKDADGNLVQKYISLPGNVLLTIDVKPDKSDLITYSLSNIHGDTMATIDPSKTLISSYDTGPFGEKIPKSKTPANATSDTTYNFAGKYKKTTESSLAISPMQMGARIYIPSLGRFLQVDPVEGGGVNPYTYVNDPVNSDDYSGEFVFFAIALIATLIVAAVIAAPEEPSSSKIVENNPIQEKSPLSTPSKAPTPAQQHKKGVFIDHVELDSKNGRLKVYPTSSAREIAQKTFISPKTRTTMGEMAWAETINLYPQANSNNMKTQFLCHWYVVSLRAPRKESWNLDFDSPDVSYISTVVQNCNPK